jgi:proton glutamate symport protein
MPKKKLFQVLIAIVLAVIAGHLAGKEASLWGVPYYQIFSLMGQLFLNALMLVVVPLVAASIISGTARMGSENAFGRLGIKTFATFLGTSAIAILVGWILAAWIQPGLHTKLLAVDARVVDIAAQANEGAFAKIEQILLRLIPSNILAVASQGQMLGLIFFCLLFGFFISKIELEPGRVLLNVWKGIFQVMMKITELVMKAMPLGVFGLVAKTVALTGFSSITSLGYFFLTVILGLILYMFGALHALLRLVARVSPLAHLRGMAPALLTAFSTSSSAATLPVSIECIEKSSGVSNRITSFVLPLGTSLNLAGSSLQVIVSVFFIAEAYGVHLNFSTQVLIFALTWLLSIGVAGIPSASLISIVIILTSLGLPADGIGLVMAIERILDMCRTTVNVYSNSCCAVLIARSEKEKLPIQVLARG